MLCVIQEDRGTVHTCVKTVEKDGHTLLIWIFNAFHFDAPIRRFSRLIFSLEVWARDDLIRRFNNAAELHKGNKRMLGYVNLTRACTCGQQLISANYSSPKDKPPPAVIINLKRKREGKGGFV